MWVRNVFRWGVSPPPHHPLPPSLTPQLQKTLDVLTLFHSPSSASSQRILTLLRNANEARQRGAIEQPDNDISPTEFQLEVIEEPNVPTKEQLKSILEYVGMEKAGEVISGANGVYEAVKGLNDPERLKRPLVGFLL